MKAVFELPPLTVLGSLEAIARNLPFLSLGGDHPLPEGVFELERAEDKFRWRQGDKSMLVPVSAISTVEVIRLQNAGQEFVAIVLTFSEGTVSMRYRMVTSHESEAKWLKDASARIAKLLDKSVDDLSVIK